MAQTPTGRLLCTGLCHVLLNCCTYEPYAQGGDSTMHVVTSNNVLKEVVLGPGPSFGMTLTPLSQL